MGDGISRRAVHAAAAAVMGVSLAGSARAAVYTGNGGAGFGGSVGGSTLTVTDGGSTINFSLATSGFNGNGLAIYLDTVAGGATSTSTFTDTQDGGRTVLSGLSGNGRALATFAPGFGADYGISVEPGSFAGIFNLATPGTFGFVASGGLDTTATTVLNFSVNKADVGLPATGLGFTFEASLVSTSGYRSNETIGTSVTVPGTLGDTPNAGFTGTQTFATANTFGVVPEPTSLAAIGLAAAALVGRRRVTAR